MGTVQTKSRLSPARRRLLVALQRLNYGRLLDLPVRKGEPVLSSPLRILPAPGQSRPRREVGLRDFELKACHVALFEAVDRLGDGHIAEVVVVAGLPIRVAVGG